VRARGRLAKRSHARRWFGTHQTPRPALPCRPRINIPPPPATLDPSHQPVHYTGYLAESGDVFLDTRRESESREPMVMVAGRGEEGGGAAGWPCRRVGGHWWRLSAAGLQCWIQRRPAGGVCAQPLTTDALLPPCHPTPLPRRPSDSSLREVGLQLALATMTKGERAAVYIRDPQYGFGEQVGGRLEVAVVSHLSCAAASKKEPSSPLTLQAR
jgi:hypothetical protein